MSPTHTTGSKYQTHHDKISQADNEGSIVWIGSIDFLGLTGILWRLWDSCFGEKWTGTTIGLSA